MRYALRPCSLVMFIGLLSVVPHTMGQMTVTNLHPPLATSSVARAVEGGQQVGDVTIGGVTRARLWNGSPFSSVDLHPPGALFSRAYGVSGGVQVGAALFPVPGASAYETASMWLGTAESYTDLTPAWAADAMLLGIHEGRMAGVAESSPSIPKQAQLWHSPTNTPSSIHPPTEAGSYCIGIHGNAQVGNVDSDFVSRAAMWHGTPESFIELHPIGAVSSSALATNGCEQVGAVEFSILPGEARRAALWRGSAQSYVDLSPSGSDSAVAWGIAGDRQVGYAQFGTVYKASMWRGTPESWVDLSQYLPSNWTRTYAYGASQDGTNLYVVGYGYAPGTSSSRALMWTWDLSAPGPCDGIDFNNDSSQFDPQDIDAFLSVYGEGPCVPAEAVCNDLDFNNDGSMFDPCDIDSFLKVFGEGPCSFCGE